MKRLFTLFVTLLTSASLMVACEEFLGDSTNPGDDNENVNPDDGNDDGNGNENGDKPSTQGGWGVVGALTHWGTDTDIAMKSSNGIYTAETTLYKGFGFRLRKDGAWIENRGVKYDMAAGHDTFCALIKEDGTEYEVMTDGLDMFVAVAGKYNITWNSNTEKIKVELLNEVNDEWHIVGDFNDWNADATPLVWSAEAMPRTYTAEFAVEEGDEFNIQHLGKSTTFYGTDRNSLGGDIELVKNGNNFVAPSTGTYSVSLDLNSAYPIVKFTGEGITDTPEPTGDVWGIVGGFSGWANDTIMAYDETNYCYYAELEMYPTDDNGFKIRRNCAWGDDRGAAESLAELPLDTDIPVIMGGSNLPLTISGIYRVEYYALQEVIRVSLLEQTEGPAPEPEPEPGQIIWGIVGDFSGWANDTIMAYDEANSYYYAELYIEASNDNGFKIRQNYDWVVNRGSVEALAELPLDTDILVVNDGHNIPLTTSGTYRVEYYPTTEAIRVSLLSGETPNPEPPIDPATDHKIYVDVTAAGWTQVYVWAWNLSNSSENYTGGSWPGELLTLTEEIDGITYWVWDAPEHIAGQTIGFIPNSSNGDQTVDLEITLKAGGNFVVLTEIIGDKWHASIDGGDVITPEPEPEPIVVLEEHSWGVVGGFTEQQWTQDIAMEIANGEATATIEITSVDSGCNEFKIRADGSWDINYGFDGTAIPLGIDVPAVKSGKNIFVNEVGTYKISFYIFDTDAGIRVQKL